MKTIFVIIYAVLMFMFMICFHELGHFIAAKLVGVKVNEFAVGMGPRLAGFQRGETTYNLRAIPLGGFCALEGEVEMDEEGNVIELDNPRSVGAQGLMQQILIFLMGPFFNVLLCLVILLIIYLSQGHNLWICIRGAFRATGYYLAIIYQSLMEIVKGNAGGDDLMGIVGMAGMIKEEAQYGFANISFLMAALSANLAIMNLVPLPALDGGKIIMAFFKKILGNKYSVKVEVVLNAICVILLLILMIFLVIKDSIRLFS